MKPIEFITLFIISGMVMFIIYWLLAEWGKRCLKQSQEYEAYYQGVKKRAAGFTVNKCNYRILLNQFIKLGDMKGGNREKNQVLFVEFAERFKSVSTN